MFVREKLPGDSCPLISKVAAIIGDAITQEMGMKNECSDAVSSAPSIPIRRRSCSTSPIAVAMCMMTITT